MNSVRTLLEPCNLVNLDFDGETGLDTWPTKFVWPTVNKHKKLIDNINWLESRERDTHPNGIGLMFYT